MGMEVCVGEEMETWDAAGVAVCIVDIECSEIWAGERRAVRCGCRKR